MFTLLCAISIQILKFFCKDRRLLLYMSRTLHLFGTDWCAMMVPIQVIRWYRMQCYDGTDSCATVVPIRRYCQFPPIPDCVDTFKIDLLSIYNNSNRGDEIRLFISYVDNIVEAYYENEGYVPKNTVDAIVEQCDQAIKGTLFAWNLPTLDELKYKVFLSLFSHEGIDDPRLYKRYGFLM